MLSRSRQFTRAEEKPWLIAGTVWKPSGREEGDGCADGNYNFFPLCRVWIKILWITIRKREGERENEIFDYFLLCDFFFSFFLLSFNFFPHVFAIDFITSLISFVWNMLYNHLISDSFFMPAAIMNF